MKKLLIVEDDTNLRRILALFLTSYGYEVLEEGTVAGALDRLDTPGLSMIVLDLRLPNGHGRRVVEGLKAKRDDVPVIILSALPDEGLLGFPVEAVLKKPTPRDQLIDAVQKAERRTLEIRGIREQTTRLRKLNDSTN